MKQKKEKIPIELVPGQFILDIAKVLDHGQKKYDTWDWVKGRPWLDIYAATMRHLICWLMGEDKDKESGLPHLSHAATNIMMLMTFSRTRKNLDNRKKL